ncbi:acetylornithine deacetylase [Sulfitobacter sabulilitoris]|uniref:Acetylornithine deacetylase n=1 Tax=Sulfitobacter sabulilitoris TaxID=2562655 RepID=A0A5S3PES3_9RHOB|nr:acetylornithine deacetylase [Sulfitobacter sabulilitoris]TMM52528.1 acetylornithine deacetylase [Sulfitobacter sabulilitoris]
MTALEDTVDLLDRLVSYPTISTDSNVDMIGDLAEYLAGLGARGEVFADESGTKANLFATLGPEGPGGILLSGHSDVVPVADQDWTSEPFVLRREGDKLFGRGTCDMKGFIAASLVMARRYADLSLTRPVHFAFTHDEETGCIGARALVPELKARGLRPDIAIIGEPTEMRVIEGHKGCCEYTTQFSGLEGHGSDPDAGVNAVEYAVRYVGRLLTLRAELIARAPSGSRFRPAHTTLNIRRIAGGVAHNVIAGRAEVDWEMRPVQQIDIDFVKTTLAAYIETELLPAMRAVHPAADISTQTLGEVTGLEPMAENAARDLVADLTGANSADVVPFGTEAGLFQEMGMDVVVCGPGSIAQAHKADEFVSLDQLQQCLTMLDRLGGRLV